MADFQPSGDRHSFGALELDGPCPDVRPPATAQCFGQRTAKVVKRPKAWRVATRAADLGRPGRATSWATAELLGNTTPLDMHAQGHLIPTTSAADPYVCGVVAVDHDLPMSSLASGWPARPETGARAGSARYPPSCTTGGAGHRSGSGLPPPAMPSLLPAQGPAR